MSRCGEGGGEAKNYPAEDPVEGVKWQSKSAHIKTLRRSAHEITLFRFPIWPFFLRGRVPERGGVGGCFLHQSRSYCIVFKLTTPGPPPSPPHFAPYPFILALIAPPGLPALIFLAGQSTCLFHFSPPLHLPETHPSTCETGVLFFARLPTPHLEESDRCRHSVSGQPSLSPPSSSRPKSQTKAR